MNKSDAASITKIAMAIPTARHKFGIKGFTLIEVMIAMMIFASAILVINSIWSANLLRIRKAKSMNEVTSLLQEKITEYEIKYRNRPLDVPDEESGDFGKDFPRMTWKMESKEFEMPDLSSTLASQDGGVDEMTVTLVKTMTEFINNSARELKVSVFVAHPKKSKKPLEYSVTLLMIDYNQEISLPGLPAGGGAGAGSGDGA